MTHVRQNFDSELHVHSTTFSLVKLGKGVKTLYYLLTSPELGYKQLSIEYFVNPTKSVDIYIHDIDLAIECDGPVHYFSTGEYKENLVDRQLLRLVRPLRIRAELYDDIHRPDFDFREITEDKLLTYKTQLKQMISDHLHSVS